MTMDLMFADRPVFLSAHIGPRWTAGTYTDDGVRDGHHGIRLANDRWLSTQPNGTYEERDSPDGPYEWYDLDPSCNVVRVTPHEITYAIAVCEP